MPAKIVMPKLQLSDLASTDIDVLSFSGTFALSELYEFQIEFATEKQLSLEDFFHKRACLLMQENKSKHGYIPVHGIVTKTSQTDSVDKFNIYELTLTPIFSSLQQTKYTHVSLDKSIPEIIEELFKREQLTNYRFDLMGTYEPREFVFQYDEVDWNFISRWLEFEGLFYYFEQQKGREVLVITDDNATLLENKHLTDLYYQAYPDQGAEDDAMSDIVSAASFELNSVPAAVLINAYNHRESSKPYMSMVQIQGSSVGVHSVWAEIMQSQAQTERYADIIAKGFTCAREIFTGVSSARGIFPGTIINHSQFPGRPDDSPLLITRAEYSGSQKRSFLSRYAATDDAPKDFFVCEYNAIEKNVPFKVQMKTPMRRVEGILPGFVDSAAAPSTVQIDKEGYYQFRIAISQDPSGKASHWVRKMESFIGDKYAINLPMHIGNEVIIDFQFGNPDLPVLTGALPNSTNRNVLVDYSQNYLGIKSQYENTLMMHDVPGDTQGIQLYTPSKLTNLCLGCDNIYQSALPDAGYLMKTDGSSYMTVALNYFRTVNGMSNFACALDSSYSVGGNRTSVVTGSSVYQIGGDELSTIEGNQTTSVAGDVVYSTDSSRNVSVMGSDSLSVWGMASYSTKGWYSNSVFGIRNESTWGGTMSSHNILSISSTMGWKFEDNGVTTMTTTPSQEIKVLANLTISCGKSMFRIDPSGITIKGPLISILGEPMVKIMAQPEDKGETAAKAKGKAGEEGAKAADSASGGEDAGGNKAGEAADKAVGTLFISTELGYLHAKQDWYHDAEMMYEGDVAIAEQINMLSDKLEKKKNEVFLNFFQKKMKLFEAAVIKFKTAITSKVTQFTTWATTTTKTYLSTAYATISMWYSAHFDTTVMVENLIFSMASEPSTYFGAADDAALLMLDGADDAALLALEGGDDAALAAVDGADDMAIVAVDSADDVTSVSGMQSMESMQTPLGPESEGGMAPLGAGQSSLPEGGSISYSTGDTFENVPMTDADIEVLGQAPEPIWGDGVMPDTGGELVDLSSNTQDVAAEPVWSWTEGASPGDTLSGVDDQMFSQLNQDSLAELGDPSLYGGESQSLQLSPMGEGYAPELSQSQLSEGSNVMDTLDATNEQAVRDNLLGFSEGEGVKNVQWADDVVDGSDVVPRPLNRPPGPSLRPQNFYNAAGEPMSVDDALMMNQWDSYTGVTSNQPDLFTGVRPGENQLGGLLPEDTLIYDNYYETGQPLVEGQMPIELPNDFAAPNAELPGGGGFSFEGNAFDNVDMGGEWMTMGQQRFESVEDALIYEQSQRFMAEAYVGKFVTGSSGEFGPPSGVGAMLGDMYAGLLDKGGPPVEDFY